MKSTLYCLLLCGAMLGTGDAWAQPSISQSVFAVAGHSFASPDVYISNTLGESFIFGGSRNDEFMCQGFQSGLGVTITSIVQFDNGPQQVKLFPNPVRDLLQIEWESGADYTILIHSAIGQRIMTVPVQQETYTRIDFSDVPPGIYLVSFQLQNGSTRFAGRIAHQL